MNTLYFVLFDSKTCHQGVHETLQVGFWGGEAEVWTIAAKKARKWYRGVLEAAERYMAKWHENEAT